MKKLLKIIENINKLTEEDVNEVTLRDEIEPQKPAEIIEPEDSLEPSSKIMDNMSLADQFDAKARIARALEALKVAVEEFKDATAEKIDLLKDQALLTGIEGIDNQVKDLENALAKGSNILGDSELNDAFKTQLPKENTESQESQDSENTEPDENEDEDEEDEMYDFDDQAGLDLIPDEE